MSCLHSCQSLLSALSYVRGLFSFTSGRLHDAKKQLRETLTVANSNDLNKLTSCSLLLLGQIFLALGNTKVALPSPSCELLADLCNCVGDIGHGEPCIAVVSEDARE